MVKLNKITTKTGDGGETGLADGSRVPKTHARVEAMGAVDEANAALGVARRHLADAPDADRLDAALSRIQNDLFDLGADLATPFSDRELGYEPLRIVDAQVDRLEREMDALNEELTELTSFVLPGGTDAAAYLHLARAAARRAERAGAHLAETDKDALSGPARRYLNRLSDFLFVAARWANDRGRADVLWVPGANRGDG